MRNRKLLYRISSVFVSVFRVLKSNGRRALQANVDVCVKKKREFNDTKASPGFNLFKEALEFLFRGPGCSFDT